MLFHLLLGADCSGRTLATLLVAWVATLMVTSILLQWDYMWIVLTILTIMFLLLCACMAYNIKKAHMRTWATEHRRREAGDGERRARRPVWTISGMTDEDRRERESRQVTDLPPSYSSVVLSVCSTQPTSDSVQRVSLTIGDPPDGPKFEEPPPYSSVFSCTDAHDRNAEAANEPNTTSSVPATKDNNAVSIDMSQAQNTRTTDD
ncbi:PREDICTED: uncharacterized protein LOC106748364 isoform X2 [Dinoponera quadriceps]|uniref:Uncharacterized protein LOC106748364 isoform X2 n=1 Tax=Dinoponera quadriceps TaxID=609295 RepID=A0A6P3XWD6_DINQU|nr:PREDICTED: uncharacterized protein LOC106748364 isoform X2 [Dinoponera quadriceps]